MIYLIGMSHAISIMDAYDPGQTVASHAARPTERPVFHRLQPVDAWRGMPALSAAVIPPGPATRPLVTVEPVEPASMRLVARPPLVELMGGIADAPDTVILSTLYGSEHALLGLVEREVPLDFVLPSRLDLGPEPGRQIVPWQAVSQMVGQASADIAHTLRMIRARFPAARILHCEPPPPIPSEAAIRATAEDFADILTHRGVAPPMLRLKWYLAANEVVRGRLDGLRVELLPAPPRACTPDGCLAEPYWQGATHGNPAYGALVLEQIAKALEAGPLEAAR